MPTFHAAHGENVRLSADSRIATRDQSSFDDGLCALSVPLSDLLPASTSADADSGDGPPQSRIQLRVTQTNDEWSGGLGLGVSVRSPATRTHSTDFPTSAASARKGWAFAQLPQSAVQVGTDVSVWLDRKERALCYEIIKNEDSEDETSGEVALDDPEILDCLDTKQQLWFYVDVYGSVSQVKILGAQVLLCGLQLMCFIP